MKIQKKIPANFWLRNRQQNLRNGKIRTNLTNIYQKIFYCNFKEICTLQKFKKHKYEKISKKI